MKVQIAVIKLVLRTNKTLSDGTHPIMLRVSFNGMKERSTGYSSTVRYWDKKNEMVKKGYPNWVMVNAQLKRLKDAAIARRDEYIASETFYTPQMILSSPEKKEAILGDLHSLIGAYIEEKGLRKKTIDNWKYAERLMTEYGVSYVQEITLEKVKSFARWLSTDKKLSEGVIKTVLQKVSAIISFGMEKGLIKSNQMANWKYGRELKNASKMDYIHWRTLELMKTLLLEELIDVNGKRWSYKEGVIDKLIDKKSDLFARYLFMMMVLWQGMAPVDIGHVRKEDIKIKSIKNEDWYCWDGKRSKTSKDIKVRIRCHTVYSQVMVNTMLMFNESEWFLPLLNGMNKETLDDQRKKRISNALVTLSPKLKQWFVEINGEIARRKVENNEVYQLIPTECTYYSARHSYAMMFMAKGGSPLALATMLGRSVNTLAQYVKLLEEDEDIVNDVYSL